MGNRNSRTDSCPDGRRTGASRGGQSAGKVVRNRSGLNWMVALAVVLLASAGPALGQFTVQPMKFDLQLTPGKLVPQVLEIHNVDVNEPHTIDIAIVDLAQSESGTWEIIEPNSGLDTSKLASLKSSIRLNRSSVTVEPGQTVPVEVLIGVPRGSRGFSCAGILASVRPRPGAENVGFLLRFMVPVIVQIANRPMRHQVQANDLELTAVEAGKRGPGSPATTLLSMEVENMGGTFPRTRPVARVWSWAGGHWRVLTTTGFQDNTDDIGLIPSAKVKITTDLGRSLPPGKYKIAGVLYVEGRRTRRIEKEVDFAGDPSVSRVAVDTPLDLLPSDEVIVQNLPGATRTTMLQVSNGSDETVNVQATLGLPRDLASIVLENGSVKGVDLDCTPWVTVEPDRFTLKREGGSVNLRITTAMPQSAVAQPSYYANLDLWAFYPDGQRAGVTTAKICVQNAKASPTPRCRALSLTPYHISGSKYQVVGRFGNEGLTHFSPIKCKAAITDLTSSIPRIGAILTGEARSYMLPGEERNFEGVLDLATLDAGDYRLSVALQYTEDTSIPWAQKQSQIRVTVEGDQRVVETTGVQEELPKVLEVKWSKAPERAIENNERG